MWTHSLLFYLFIYFIYFFFFLNFLLNNQFQLPLCFVLYFLSGNKNILCEVLYVVPILLIVVIHILCWPSMKNKTDKLVLIMEISKGY